jgi:hypothetical protein
MKNNEIMDIEATAMAYYSPKMKRDIYLMVTITIAMLVGTFTSIVINGSLTIFIVFTSTLILLLINYIINWGERSDWIWASVYTAKFPPGSPYAVMLNLSSRPNLEKIFQDMPKLKKSRFGKSVQKTN